MNFILGWALSFRLWRALWGRVPGHPLMTAAKPKRPPPADNGCSPVVIAALLLMALPVMWVVGFVLALLAIIVGGTLRGMFAAALTARAVYQERSAGRLDLLGMTPAGTLGTGWVLALREFRQSNLGQSANRYIQNAQRVIGIGGLSIVAIIALGTLVFQFDGIADMDGDGITPPLDYVFGVIQLILVVLLWLLTDNAQSPLIGTLVGIWSGLRSRRKPEAAGMAAALYAALQVLLIAPVTGLGIALFRWPDGVRVGLVVLIMMLARETLLRVLWTYLCHDLNANGAELPAALRL